LKSVTSNTSKVEAMRFSNPLAACLWRASSQNKPPLLTFPVGVQGLTAEYGAGLKVAIVRGWLWMRESGTYVKFKEAGAALFA
jgi:hypothetical protein